MIYFTDTGYAKFFPTGAYLLPMKIKNENGEECWIWTVSEFIDDSFKDGKVFNPTETAKSLEDLLIYTTTDE